MLDVTDLDAGYGETQVLYGLSLSARPGRVLAVLGRNGAGKSTTLKTAMGLLPARSGDIVFDGASIANRRPFDIARTGIAYVPETRDIFPSLTVRENLELASRRFAVPEGGWTFERAIALFPRLGERLNVKLIHDKLKELREAGLSMILVEQNFGFAVSLADDVVIVSKGQVVWTGSP